MHFAARQRIGGLSCGPGPARTPEHCVELNQLTYSTCCIDSDCHVVQNLRCHVFLNSATRATLSNTGPGRTGQISSGFEASDVRLGERGGWVDPWFSGLAVVFRSHCRWTVGPISLLLAFEVTQALVEQVSSKEPLAKLFVCRNRRVRVAR